jgi:hypothetical protein
MRTRSVSKDSNEDLENIIDDPSPKSPVAEPAERIYFTKYGQRT